MLRLGFNRYLGSSFNGCLGSSFNKYLGLIINSYRLRTSVRLLV
jgi:hypothetical protein